MRPSLSVTLEPGLERGVPWGRDLYTFVTSAAGHMMRALQKPRKSRSSKRQVNHRRFLQNMIQRKFADIEAANHRLSSALIYKEKDDSILCLLSQKPETLDQSGAPSEKSNLHSGADDISKPRRVSDETEVREEKQSEPDYLQKQHPKSQSYTDITRKKNERKGRQRKENGNHKLVDFTSTSFSVGPDFHHRSELFNESFIDECQPAMTYNFPEDSQEAHEDLSFIPFDQNGDISLELSPLSLNSCEVSLQMFRDVLTQTNVADISESQWTDLIDLFSVGSKDLGHMDVEAYLESICACQGDNGQEGCVDGAGFSDQSGGFMPQICSLRSEIEAETGDDRYECGYIYQGDQGMKSNHCQRQHKDGQEIQFVNTFKPTQDAYIIHNQLSTSISYYNPSELQLCHHPREETPCMLIGDENQQSLTLFEGIAQSFSVPLHNPEDRSIPTPPHEDEWLFTDILKDRKVPYSEDFMSSFKRN